MWHSHLRLPAGLYNSNTPAASETENIVFSSLRHTSPWQPLLWPRASSTLWAWIHFNDSHIAQSFMTGDVWEILSQPSLPLPIVECQVHSSQRYQDAKLTGGGRGVSFLHTVTAFFMYILRHCLGGITQLLWGEWEKPGLIQATLIRREDHFIDNLYCSDKNSHPKH